MSIAKKEFGTLKSGKAAYLYTIRNKNDAEISVTDFGASLVTAVFKDKAGKPVDVVLGYDSVGPYEINKYYFGQTIGRSANRIENGRFVIDGTEYQLPQNEKGNSLHSGPDGYGVRIWDSAEADESKNTVTFRLNSPDGDQGYPGNFNVAVSYTLTDDNEIIIRYEGLSDKKTIANMTNHSYFNLNGHGSGSVLNHKLQISASAFTPVKDSKAIPTGELLPVENTPMDFRTAKKIGQDIDAEYEQLKFGLGYDHNYALDNWNGKLQKIAESEGDITGIIMEVYTDLPGVQFYSGNFITNEEGKEGALYINRGGFCLETQFFPNSANEPAFASPVLNAGEKYQTTTIYKFK